ncbi:hypothetical protein YC6258_05089 [Gynuella sunshinyii YC6258]|uniref:S1 motif domain-containing protein n=2 Tax=Gynuella sunshinyii TaxID=1445505 RepID=A0A0C5W395_9GAMM|nr:S1-like domain-containing RNA-binding protein [Gynuella sunshinyii]AJQ97119.1 hypothetical protein YC6258_05089 [Gynuella sunshinyii YC6258]
MVNIGQFNRLTVTKLVNFGVYLDAGEHDNILLPRRDVPPDCKVGDKLHVFIYHDSEDRLIATTRKPLAMVGDTRLLKVKDTGPFGAFLDWGLDKDLLVPFGQQRRPMEVGHSYVVHLYIDEYTERVVASSKLNHFLSETADQFQANQEVDLLVCQRTDIGYKAVINQTHLGVIFTADLLQPLKIGEKLKGYIKQIRADGKIDLSLQLQGQEVRDQLADLILEHLRTHGGVSDLTDKSTPEDIYRQYQVSKGNYKKAIGGLYKKRLIHIEKDCIRLSN